MQSMQDWPISKYEINKNQEIVEIFESQCGNETSKQTKTLRKECKLFESVLKNFLTRHLQKLKIKLFNQSFTSYF